MWPCRTMEYANSRESASAKYVMTFCLAYAESSSQKTAV